MQTTSNQWSVIVWHTGTPDKTGNYIVTGKSEEGIFVIEDIYMSNNKWWVCDNCEVLAWCPIKNIKPYKEEQ